MATRFAYAAVGSALHDPAALARTVDAYRPGFERLGGTQAGTGADLPLVVLVLTGGTERRLLDLWHGPPEPLVLVAHPDHNSLAAALEALARVRQEGGRGRIVYLAGPDDERGWGELGALVAGLAARRALGATRLGLVGDPSEWLVASMPAPGVVERRWGPHVVRVPVEELLARTRRAGAPADLATSLVAGAGSTREPTPEDVVGAARVAPALRDLVGAHRLDAVTVRCFDLVTEAGTSGCVALSDLNDAGVVAGCEGDVVSAVAMLWVQALLGTTSWIANPARVDVEANRILLAHCTIARSLTDGYDLRSHFESGIGVGIAGHLTARAVTLVRIGGADLDELWLGEGAITDQPHEEGLCRTQVEVGLDEGHVADVLARPLGNHVVVVPGRHAGALRSWWELFVAR